MHTSPCRLPAPQRIWGGAGRGLPKAKEVARGRSHRPWGAGGGWERGAPAWGRGGRAHRPAPAPDPADWSPGNVQKWILWTEHQYRLPQIGKSFQELSGKDLCAMSEEQFCQRSPVCGDVLHAHLDIWKSGKVPGTGGSRERVMPCWGKCSLTARSSLPAAWMKEKAAPGDVRYCGEFRTGSAPPAGRGARPSVWVWGGGEAAPCLIAIIPRVGTRGIAFPPPEGFHVVQQSCKNRASPILQPCVLVGLQEGWTEPLSLQDVEQKPVPPSPSLGCGGSRTRRAGLSGSPLGSAGQRGPSPQPHLSPSLPGGDTSWADSEVDSSCAGQPIHLWQFLKELLLKPHNYGRFIRWLNKEKGGRAGGRALRRPRGRGRGGRGGDPDVPVPAPLAGIFKIEDSAQVARLWGIRKNRPAMNYDKLSRSIRQYYKKGIIRKPDISQRLVYQFVHPV